MEDIKTLHDIHIFVDRIICLLPSMELPKNVQIKIDLPLKELKDVLTEIHPEWKGKEDEFIKFDYVIYRYLGIGIYLTQKAI